MIIVLPVSQNDFNKPLNVFSFLKTLRSFRCYDKHELLIVGRPSAVEYVNAVYGLVEDLFPKKKIHIFSEDGPTGWPEGPNFYWKQTNNYLQKGSDL